MYNKLTCLFGHHDYDNKVTIDKDVTRIHLCKHCKRSARLAWSGEKIWYDYDEEGNRIHVKRNGGHETWFDYDEEGNCIYQKWRDEYEVWFDKNGYITRERFPNGDEYRCDTTEDIARTDLKNE